MVPKEKKHVSASDQTWQDVANEDTRGIHFIEALQDVTKALGRMPRENQGEFREEAKAVAHFGSWATFLRAARQQASLSVYPAMSPRNPVFLIQEVQKVARTLGRAPKGNQEEFAYTRLAIQQFGTWKQFIEAADLTERVVHANQKYSNADLIREAQRIAQVLGRAPLSTHGEFPYRMTVIRRFGSWRNFLEAAHLTKQRAPSRRSKKYSDAFLLQELRRVAKELGRTPVSTTSKKEFAYTTLASYRFGSWKQFVEAAGLEVAPRANKSKQAR